jgi:hypothetical protein
MGVPSQALSVPVVDQFAEHLSLHARGFRQTSARLPVCSLRVCGNPLDRLVLDRRAGDLVTRRLPCQSREAGCRGALPYELLDVRRR